MVNTETELLIHARAIYEQFDDDGGLILQEVHLEGGQTIQFDSDARMFAFFQWLAETFKRPVDIRLATETTEYTLVTFG